MTEVLIIPVIIGFVGFVFIWLRYKYIEWKEARSFWKRVENMIEREDKRRTESLKKALEIMRPFIGEMIEKAKKSNISQ